MDLNSSRHILNPTNISLCNTIISRSSLLNSGRKGNTHTHKHTLLHMWHLSLALDSLAVTSQAGLKGLVPHLTKWQRTQRPWEKIGVRDKKRSWNKWSFRRKEVGHWTHPGVSQTEPKVEVCPLNAVLVNNVNIPDVQWDTNWYSNCLATSRFPPMPPGCVATAISCFVAGAATLARALAPL